IKMKDKYKNMSINDTDDDNGYVIIEQYRDDSDDESNPPLIMDSYANLPPHVGSPQVNVLSNSTSIATLAGLNKSHKARPLHMISLISIMAVGFIANVEYGIVMPSINDYIQSKTPSHGGNSGSSSNADASSEQYLPLVGIWSDRRTIREAICVNLLIAITGNIIYATAVNPIMIVLGRVVTGVGSSNMALTNTYIAAVTSREQRTKYMGQINAINAIGLVAGPAFNLLLSVIKFKIQIKSFVIVVDPLNCPGYFLAFLLTCCLISFAWFKEPKRKSTFWQNFKMLLNRSLITCFIINFVQNFVFGALETMITPITQEQYHFGTLSNSIMYSVISSEIIVFIFVTVFASSKFGVQDKYMVLFGQVFLGAGLVQLFINFGGPADRKVQFWRFCLSVAVTVVGIPTQNTSIYSLYSKLLNRIFGDKQQGFQTGFMMLMGSLGRIIGPLWASYGLAMSNRIPLCSVFLVIWAIDISFTLFNFKSLTFKHTGKPTTLIISH
ncbi:hypothetical protein SAMD00019534_095540, partial [Acytostelium subglobosum LB1]|uniref:hypothetical protein n=1 Tax=Acytostelium subglobosum LB1 TaxID=1410327 RepID=UPI000644B237